MPPRVEIDATGFKVRCRLIYAIDNYIFCIVQEKNQISSLFRARLQALLSERGISQRQVALATGLSQQTVNNYLRAVSKLPGAHELLVLSRYFGVSMEYFVVGDEETRSGPAGKKSPELPPVVPASEVRRAAERMDGYAEELRAEAKRLKKLSGHS